MSATNQFSIFLREVNSAPVLETITAQSIVIGQTLTVILQATDSDIPTNRLTFALVGGPVGVSVSSNGLLQWTPAATNVGSHPVVVKVTDDGVPPMADAKSFAVVVQPITPKLDAPAIAAAPTNMTVVAGEHALFFDAEQKKVKFGVFFDDAPRTLTYEVVPPLGAMGKVEFKGIGSLDGSSTNIAGASIIESIPLHPADNNPADFRMTLTELTAYGFAWRKGNPWPIAPNPIPIDYVARAGALWKGGELYALDSAVPAPPLWWVNIAATDQPLARVGKAQLGNRSRVDRSVPRIFVGGEALKVTLAAAPDVGIQAYALEEQVPPGWSVTSVDDTGEVDPVGGQVRWGPVLDGKARQFTYWIRPPEDAGSAARFAGAASFDGQRIEVSGDSSSQSGCRLSFARRFSDNLIELSFVGLFESKNTIEASSNLVDWEQVTIRILGRETLIIEDSGHDKAQRFYRVAGPTTP